MRLHDIFATHFFLFPRHFWRSVLRNEVSLKLHVTTVIYELHIKTIHSSSQQLWITKVLVITKILYFPSN